jgi:hypothetical protein
MACVYVHVDVEVLVNVDAFWKISQDIYPALPPGNDFRKIWWERLNGMPYIVCCC